MLRSLWLVLAAAQWIPAVIGQACPAGGVQVGEGTGVAGNNNNWAPGGGGNFKTYINDVTGGINCHGVVTSWTFRQSNNAACNAADPVAKLQIWRAAGVNDFTLVGENDYDCSVYSPAGGNQEVTFNVARDQRIPVQPADVIGWAMEDVLMKDSGTATYNLKYSNAAICDGIAPGNDCTNVNLNVNVNPLIYATIEQAPPPTIADLPTTVSVWENEGAQDIYTVNAAHEVNSVPGNVMANQAPLTYTLIAGPDFGLGGAPGAPGSPRDIRTTGPGLNYEAAQLHLVVVEVEAMELTATATLTVSVLDRNEAHVITNPAMTRYVSATTTYTDELIHTVLISDVDTLSPTTKTYHLLSTTPNPLGTAPTDGPFYLDATTGELRASQDLQDWVVTPTADTAEYDVLVSVADDLHVVYDTITVIIQNLKVAPVLSNVPITVQLPEDALPGSSIFQVTATGPDPAELRFTINSVAPVSHFYSFTINTVSGEIFLSADPNLDYSLVNEFVLDIGVRDHLHTGLPLLLTIQLQWRNRQPHLVPESYTTQIYENCDNAALCNGMLSITLGGGNLPLNDTDRDRDALPFAAPDPDPTSPTNTGTPEQLTCSVEPGFGQQFFDFGAPPNNCKDLLLVASIDLDSTPQYEFINLTVKVEDRFGKSSIGFVNITVLYINDYSPVIGGTTPYEATIPENTPGGRSILNVTATDGDLGADGEITFYLTAVTGLLDGTLYFEVNDTTGEIFTKQGADFETINPKQIEFNVYAQDAGTRPSQLTSAPIRVTVYITDVNDNAPTWNCTNRDLSYEPYDVNDTCFYNLDIRDDTLVGYEIVRIFAEDIDTVTPSENITFFLLTPNYHILVQREDGHVLVKADLEEYTEYIVYAYAQDNGDPDLWSQIMYLRVDTYDPQRQLINIVMGKRLNFNDTALRNDLLSKLRDVLYPWFPKMWSFTLGQDRTTISIYALTDDSTYDQANLPYPKQFVDRDQLLPPLRKSFLGTPRDYLTEDPFTNYNIILVEPTFPIWWIDTIPGIVTIAVLCLLFVGIVVGIAVGLCKKYNKLCFKKKPPNRAWTQQQPPAKSQPPPNEEPVVRHRVQRAPSIDTIHSLIFDSTKDRMF